MNGYENKYNKHIKPPKLIKDIYIHIPFCNSKCPYCIFFSFRSSENNIDNFLRGIEYEIKNCRISYSSSTLHIGGGTPSLIQGNNLKIFLNILNSYSIIPEHGEFAVEVNPESLRKDDLVTLKDNGLNRISIGVQALDDARLRFLGRVHSKKDAIKAIRTAKYLNIGSVSVDFIYDLPGDNPDIIERELLKLISLQPDHISAYSLSIEKGSIFFNKLKRCEFELPDENIKVENFLKVIKTLKSCGYYQYEVSNFTRGYADRSRHNSHIWQGKPYLGFGPGSVSRVEKMRSRNISNLKSYSEGENKYDVEYLSEYQLKEEKLITGLRRAEGVRLSIFANIKKILIDELVDENLIILTKTRLKVTEKGLFILNHLIYKLSEML